MFLKNEPISKESLNLKKGKIMETQLEKNPPATRCKLTEEFWNQKEVNGNVVKKRVVYGGKMSGKLTETLFRMLELAASEKLNFLVPCVYDRTDDTSVYAKFKIEHFGFSDEFTFTEPHILTHKDNGSSIHFMNKEEILEKYENGEMNDFNFCVVWNTHSLTKEFDDTLSSIVSKNEGECWYAYHPQFTKEYAWKSLVNNSPDGCLCIKLNIYDNEKINPSALQYAFKTVIENKEYSDVFSGIPKEA